MSEMEPEPLDTQELARAGAGMLTLLLAIMVVLTIVVEAAGIDPGDPNYEAQLNDAPGVQFVAFLLVSVVTGLLAYGFSSGPLSFLLGSRSALGWRGYIGGAAATMFTGLSVMFLVAAVGNPASESNSFLAESVMTPSPDLATLVIVSIVLTGPLGEELFFRGFLMDSLNRVLGSGYAILLSATLFGLIHFDPVQSFAATVMGVVLGILAVSGGSLRPAIVAHVFNNLIFVVVNRFGSSSIAEPETHWGAIENLLAALVTGALALAILVFAVGRARLLSVFRREPAAFA